MGRYSLGDPALNAQLAELINSALDGHDGHEHDVDLISEMMVSGLKLLRDDTDRGDLKLVNTAIKEMRYSFVIFSQYRDIPKVTIYGSARTPPGSPNYQLAADFASRMADDHRWMIITGAGPGIMEAGNKGAGREYTFGVNIRLPFESDANKYIHESRLINFKYFFTRKLMFVKESDAFVVFPGGFGTQDETFELLTLIQTGKSDLHPIVLIEAEGTNYWGPWVRLVENLRDQGMISPDDFSLFKVTNDCEEACEEILHFYANYHSQRYVKAKLVLRIKHEPSTELLETLNSDFADILIGGRIEQIEATEHELADDDNVDLFRLRLHFDRRSHGKLRQLIDLLNDSV
ncbi:MAG: TIGR00730 family Rossman fold protein [Acidobacteria bacterium]|nr:TIGR00730 family Rossman fold protein [Acidobacteriota bacterium]